MGGDRIGQIGKGIPLLLLAGGGNREHALDEPTLGGMVGRLHPARMTNRHSASSRFSRSPQRLAKPSRRSAPARNWSPIAWWMGCMAAGNPARSNSLAR